MYVAEIEIIVGQFTQSPAVHRIPYCDLAAASTEFDRLKVLIRAENERHNDKPTMIEVDGDGSQMTCALREIRSISLIDYEENNKHFGEAKAAFPHMCR